MPSYFLRFSYWQNINTTAPFAWSFALIALACGSNSIVWLALIFMGLGNLVHRWAHENPRNVPRLVRWLQAIGIFISYKQHREHHWEWKHTLALERHEAHRRYCVMSSWLNPILDRGGFFKLLELMLRVIRRLRNS